MQQHVLQTALTLYQCGTLDLKTAATLVQCQCRLQRVLLHEVAWETRNNNSIER